MIRDSMQSQQQQARSGHQHKILLLLWIFEDPFWLIFFVNAVD